MVESGRFSKTFNKGFNHEVTQRDAFAFQLSFKEEFRPLFFSSCEWHGLHFCYSKSSGFVIIMKMAT